MKLSNNKVHKNFLLITVLYTTMRGECIFFLFHYIIPQKTEVYRRRFQWYLERTFKSNVASDIRVPAERPNTFPPHLSPAKLPCRQLETIRIKGAGESVQYTKRT